MYPTYLASFYDIGLIFRCPYCAYDEISQIYSESDFKPGTVVYEPYSTWNVELKHVLINKTLQRYKHE